MDVNAVGFRCAIVIARATACIAVSPTALAVSDSCEYTGPPPTMPRGTARELCRWYSISTEAACSKTSGLWTSSDSRYAKNHPDAVPKGQSGACISEAANLLRKR